MSIRVERDMHDDPELQRLSDELKAAFVLYKYACRYANTLVWQSADWRSARCMTDNLERQYWANHTNYCRALPKQPGKFFTAKGG